MVRVGEDWRWEKRGRRTGKQSKADRDRKDEVVDRNEDGDSQRKFDYFMGIAAFIYQVQKKTMKRIDGTGKRVTLQRQSTEILKKIFPEKEYPGLIPHFHIHASVSDFIYSHDRSAYSAGGNM